MKKFRLKLFLGIYVYGMLVYGGCGGYEEKPYLWNAESQTIGWKPLAESVNISRAKGVVFLKGSKSSLHISGTAGEPGFAVSQLYPMDELAIYSVSAGIKVNEKQPESSIPSILCQFLTSDTNFSLGKITLSKSNKFHESEQLGKWHIHSAKFRAPLGTEQFKFAIVQNSDSLHESTSSQAIDINIDFIDVRPVENFDPNLENQLKEVQASDTSF